MNLACAHMDEDWDLLALGSLDEATQRTMESHLQSGCKECRRKFMEAQLAVVSVSAISPPARPSARAERELMKRIRQESSPKNAWSWPRWNLAPWAVATACLVLAGWLFWQQRTLRMELGNANNSIQSLRQELSSQSAAQPSQVQPPALQPAPPTTAVNGTALVLPENKKLAQLESAIKNLQQENAVLAAARAQAEQQAATLQSQLNTAQARTEALTRDLQAAQKSTIPANAANDNQIADLTHQLSQTRAELARLQEAGALNAQVEALLQSGSIRQIELRPIDPAAGAATAHALYSPRGGLLLIADSLPHLDHEKCYQLWLIRKGTPAILSAGLLQTSADGRGFLFAPPTSDLAQLTALAITDEPKGGSPSARGHKLLFGAQ
jgi:anti-sigma-K factor RskA